MKSISLTAAAAAAKALIIIILLYRFFCVYLTLCVLCENARYLMPALFYFIYPEMKLILCIFLHLCRRCRRRLLYFFLLISRFRLQSKLNIRKNIL